MAIRQLFISRPIGGQSIHNTNTKAWSIPCITNKTRNVSKEEGKAIILLLLKFFPHRFSVQKLSVFIQECDLWLQVFPVSTILVLERKQNPNASSRMNLPKRPYESLRYKLIWPKFHEGNFHSCECCTSVCGIKQWTLGEIWEKNKRLYQNYLWEPNPPKNPLPTDRQIRKWPQWRTEAARYEHIYSDEQWSSWQDPAKPDTNERNWPEEALKGSSIDNELAFVSRKYKLCSKKQKTIIINRREINTGNRL